MTIIRPLNRFERQWRRSYLALAVILAAMFAPWAVAVLFLIGLLVASASGTRLLAADGSRQLAIGGERRLGNGEAAGDDCCCTDDEPAPIDCPYCNGTTPKYATVSFGLTLCPNCTGSPGAICMVATGECAWETTRSWNCCKLRCNDDPVCMTGTMSLTDDGAGGGRLTLDIPGVFYGFTDGVSTCASVAITNTLTCAAGSASDGGTATVTWGGCDPSCPACGTPEGATCDCVPNSVTVNLSGINLDTRFCPPDRPDLICIECPSAETISASVVCTPTVVGRTNFFGEGAVVSDCGFNGVKISRLTVRALRLGCRWYVGARVDNDGNGVSSTLFCGVSGIIEDCTSSAVLSNDSNGSCYSNAAGCDVVVCNGLVDEGSPIGSGGTATVVPC